MDGIVRHHACLSAAPQQAGTSLPCHASALTNGMRVEGRVAWVASSTTTTLNCPCLPDSVRTESPTDEQVPATTCRDSRWDSQRTAEVMGVRLCLTLQVSTPPI